MAQSLLGNIKNKHTGLDVAAGDVAAAVKLTRGLAVYQDGANGFKVVPTAAQPDASAIRFSEVEQDNLTGVKGDKKVETYKSGTIMIVKAQGNIAVGSKLRASTVTAGSLAQHATVDANYVANYLGHPDEVGATGKEITAAADGQEILVYIV